MIGALDWAPVLARKPGEAITVCPERSWMATSAPVRAARSSTGDSSAACQLSFRA